MYTGSYGTCRNRNGRGLDDRPSTAVACTYLKDRERRQAKGAGLDKQMRRQADLHQVIKCWMSTQDMDAHTRGLGLQLRFYILQGDSCSPRQCLTFEQLQYIQVLLLFFLTPSSAFSVALR